MTKLRLLHDTNSNFIFVQRCWFGFWFFVKAYGQEVSFPTKKAAQNWIDSYIEEKTFRVIENDGQIRIVKLMNTFYVQYKRFNLWLYARNETYPSANACFSRLESAKAFVENKGHLFRRKNLLVIYCTNF